MRPRGLGCRTVLLLVAGAVALCDPSSSKAEDSGGSSSAAGIAVDAQGVLRMQTFADPTGLLTRQRIAAARVALDPQVAKFNHLRKISLRRLEEVIRQRQGVLTDEMRYLAGLQRVRYVFCYPESGDVVIAGPAEGWVTDLAGRVVGISTGRPVVLLQDVVVALRAFPPDGKAAEMIGCSIDPTTEGLAALQQFLRSFGTRATPADTPRIVQGLQASLGMHDVTIRGVSPKSHFAQVMVEADYRMKLIGIGLEAPPVRLVSYVERATASQISRSALQRWFFTPDYQCVRASEDGLAMELVGDGVKLVGEDEVVTASGERKLTSGSNRASQAFVNEFTKKYSALAARSPVYAQLRNLIDLAVAAAYIQQEDFYNKTAWSMDFFGHEQSFAVECYSIPKTVQTAVNAIWKGNRLATPVAGGVTIHPTTALLSDNLLPDDRGLVNKAREQTTLDLAEGQWWWD